MMKKNAVSVKSDIISTRFLWISYNIVTKITRLKALKVFILKKDLHFPKNLPLFVIE